jgi:hypothetical protein
MSTFSKEHTKVEVLHYLLSYDNIVSAGTNTKTSTQLTGNHSTGALKYHCYKMDTFDSLKKQ